MPMAVGVVSLAWLLVVALRRGALRGRRMRALALGLLAAAVATLVRHARAAARRTLQEQPPDGDASFRHAHACPISDR